MKQGHGPSEQGHGPGRRLHPTVAAPVLAPAAPLSSPGGAGGAMYGYALETDGTTYCHVAAIGGSRAADSADVVGSVRGHRAAGSRLRNRNTALSGDGDAGSQ